MMLDARQGTGCAHCETGVAMAWFGMRGHIVALCMGCLMGWFPGRSAEWLEERLDSYGDHLGYKLAKANPEYGETDEDRHRKYFTRPEYDAETGRWSARRPDADAATKDRELVAEVRR